MTKISINILTKNRAQALHAALESVSLQSYKDFEVVLVNDGSTDETEDIIKTFKNLNILTINHESSAGIISSRQEALKISKGKYIAILDDDDEWVDIDKLKKQVEFLDSHEDYVLVGGGMEISQKSKVKSQKFRAETDGQIRKTMLFRNNFFTSTVMFRKDAAIKEGGFILDGVDLCEDYDLWLRIGKLGKMHNFQEVFTKYRQSDYNKDKFMAFLKKQSSLIEREKHAYQRYFLAKVLLKFRIAIAK